MEDTAILEFQGDNRWLSNFWPAQVVLDGVTYPSVEHAYQAAKTHPCSREKFRKCTAGQAKRLGKFVDIRKDWEQIKVQTMRHLIAQKFDYGTYLGKKLVATGTCYIAEGNKWGDVFWGVSGGRGENWLGKLLMERREQLRHQ